MNESDREISPIPPPRTWGHHLARAMIMPLVDTPITANQLTVCRLLTGLLAAACFAMGDYFWGCIGGALFALSTLLDRADGELARVTRTTSTSGHWFDLKCDLSANVMAFIGIGIGVGHGELGSLGIVMGFVAGGSIGAIFLIVFALHDVGSHPNTALGGTQKFDLDDGLFLLAPIAWFNQLQNVLIVASLGAPLFLIYAWFQYRNERNRRNST